jgi:hypothetical protein
MNYEEREAVKQALKDQLIGTQPFALDTVRWLYYGARGGGRTHLICTAALLEVAEGRGVWLVDHYPWSEPLESYVRTVLFQIAANVGMKIKVHLHRRGALFVELDNEEYRS